MNIEEFFLTLVIIAFIGTIIGGIIALYFFSTLVKFIYSSTNNLFLTITLVASIIFFIIALNNSSNTYPYYNRLPHEKKNEGFLQNGGLYYIISGVFLIISFIINLLSKRNTTSKNQINTSKKI